MTTPSLLESTMTAACQVRAEDLLVIGRRRESRFDGFGEEWERVAGPRLKTINPAYDHRHPPDSVKGCGNRSPGPRACQRITSSTAAMRTDQNSQGSAEMAARRGLSAVMTP